MVVLRPTTLLTALLLGSCGPEPTVPIACPADLPYSPGGPVHVAVGQTFQVVYSPRGPCGSRPVPAGPWSVRSRNPSVARIGTEGVVTAVGAGETAILIESPGIPPVVTYEIKVVVQPGS